MLPALVGVAALGGASVATEDCGSVPADVDGAAQDASVDGAGPDAHVASDGSGVGPCGDAGYYITINGDGVPQTLLSNWGSPDVVVPSAFYQPPCDPLFVILGSDNPDGGTRLYVEIDSTDSPGPGSPPQGPATLVYVRPDGTVFHSASAFGQPTYTELEGPGGVVAGSYALTVATSTQPDAATLSLSGAFCTLRVADGQPQNCPP